MDHYIQNITVVTAAGATAAGAAGNVLPDLQQHASHQVFSLLPLEHYAVNNWFQMSSMNV